MQLPLINSREAVPVRLIQFVTSGYLGPSSTAHLLAGSSGICWFRDLRDGDHLKAYRLSAEGQIVEMKPSEWETPKYAIKSLSERYDKHDRHYDEWLNVAIGLLPPVFVWKDEFSSVYNNAYSEHLKDAGYAELVWDPYIPVELMEIVFSGFESFPTELNRAQLQSLSEPEPEPAPLPASLGMDSIPPVQVSRKCGRAKSALTEAVEFLYQKFLAEGNTEILRPGKIEEFMVRLKEFCHDSRKQNVFPEVTDRISSVQKVAGVWEIKTVDQYIKAGKLTEINKIGRKYLKTDVAKCLTQLRGKFPIPP